jgi:hypothetical protein
MLPVFDWASVCSCVLTHDRSAHAAYAPWEAQNALDAAFLAYSGISVLRQQMKPTHRVHGVVSGKDLEANGRSYCGSLAINKVKLMVCVISYPGLFQDEMGHTSAHVGRARDPSRKSRSVF